MKGIKSLTVLGFVLVAVGLIGLVFTYNYEQETVSEKRTIPEGEINNVDVHSENAKVEIIAANDTSPRAELSGTNSKGSKYEFDVNLSDGKLSIELKQRMKKLYSFDFRATGLTLKVFLPEKEFESLMVMNGNGKVTINSLHAEDINAITSNGFMEIENIKSSLLKVEADNGKIYAENLNTDELVVTSDNGILKMANVEAETVHAETNNGKITMDDVSGNITGKTNNGEISLMTHDLERTLELETDNGVINIKTEERPKNVRFEVNVDNGKVNILDEFNGSTVIGNGDNLIQLTAHNGSINVK